MSRARNEQETAVVFRRWQDGDVLALFPGVDEGRGLCSSYARIGQHGAADYGACIARTRAATSEESAPLKRELEQIGYELRVVRRYSRPRRRVKGEV